MKWKGGDTVTLADCHQPLITLPRRHINNYTRDTFFLVNPELTTCHDATAILGLQQLWTAQNKRCWYSHLLIMLWKRFSLKHWWYCVRLYSCWGLGRWYRVKDGTRSSTVLGDSPYKTCLISVGIGLLILASLWQTCSIYYEYQRGHMLSFDFVCWL